MAIDREAIILYKRALDRVIAEDLQKGGLSPDEASRDRSPSARRKRIEVRPDAVRVVVPEEATAEDVERFMQSKRRWLHDKTEEMREAAERLRSETPQGVHSGAKVLFRGRHLRLRVESGDVDRARLAYRTAFHVTLPRDLPRDERAEAIREVLDRWLADRLLEDAREVVRRRGEPRGLTPRDIRVKDQRTLWGSCGRDGVLPLDRKLARLPKPVLEYVVVHELCHLRHRDHSAAFWRLVQRVLPDYRERKEWLGHEMVVG